VDHLWPFPNEHIFLTFFYLGMRRFLVDRSNCPEAGGSDGPARHPNVEEPTGLEERPNEAPGHPEPEPDMGNVTSEFDPNEIRSDPALRKQIYEYAPDIQDQVRRAYILKGPSQPTNILKDPKTRGFSMGWYKKYNWLEYSESKDAGYCFYCFLFKQPGRAQHFGHDVFNKTGWRDWRHAYKALPEHVGGVGSAHNQCVQKYADFKNQRQNVQRVIDRATKQSEELYEIRLTSSLRCSRLLIKCGLSFRGHDESASSLNKGNFQELVDFLKDNNEEVRNAYDRGGLNCKMTSPDIQKDLTRCCAEEITEAIMEEIGNRPFSVLIDESRDISVKEQMAVILRYAVNSILLSNMYSIQLN
jgi:hypothetical protein